MLTLPSSFPLYTFDTIIIEKYKCKAISLLNINIVFLFAKILA